MGTFYSRKPTRIPGFDYSGSYYYFVTICTHEKQCLFGKPGQLNDIGKIAEDDLKNVNAHFDNMEVVRYVVMPNHIHAIISIGCYEADGITPNLNVVIGQYKSGVTRRVRVMIPDKIVWQRSYHDHIIRNDMQFRKIWEYIDTNPLRWEQDCFYREI